MLYCFFDRTWECSSLEWVCWCRVTQAVLCPHMLTSQIAEHSWDRLEPESASSRLSEHEKRGRGLRLQTKDGSLNPVSSGTELHSQSRRRSHEPSCPFSENANIFALSSPQLCFSPLISSKPSVQGQTQSHDWFFFKSLRIQKCWQYYIHIFRFLFFTFTTNYIYQWNGEKTYLQSAAPGWSAGPCVCSDMWEVPKKTKRLGEVLPNLLTR